MRQKGLNISGFTLIELLVVVAIVGILASIVLLSLQNARERAKLARFKEVVHSIQTKAVEVCNSGTIVFTNGSGSFGTFPVDIDASGITEVVSQNCGSNSRNSFRVAIPSANLSTRCTAVIEETGITSFTAFGGGSCQ